MVEKVVEQQREAEMKIIKEPGRDPPGEARRSRRIKSPRQRSLTWAEEVQDSEGQLLELRVQAAGALCLLRSKVSAASTSRAQSSSCSLLLSTFMEKLLSFSSRTSSRIPDRICWRGR